MKEIILPKLSDTMTEGTVIAWRKAPGEPIERGEVLAEVETDKAIMELEAFAGGVLLEIRVAAGVAVPVGTVIGVIGAAGEVPAPRETEPAAASVSVAGAPPAPPAPSIPVPTVIPPAPDDVPAVPVVRRRARELGIDLRTVRGSGPGGRILLEDLDAAPAGQSTPVPPVPAEPASLPPAPSVPAAESNGEPLTRMRAAIARTVSESWRTIPHFSVAAEVRMDAAEQLLRRLKAEGAAVSLTALLVKATAQVLRQFPRLNASLLDQQVVIHPAINIGIVVRLGDGLLVPVLRDCATRPLFEVAGETARLVERARHGQLSDTELSGGTFAISNLGRYGVDSFVALILPPMAAVLAVGAVRDGVAVQDGRPVAARLLTLTVSADHRLVDGAYAAEFLQGLKPLLEAPDQLADG